MMIYKLIAILLFTTVIFIYLRKSVIKYKIRKRVKNDLLDSYTETARNITNSIAKSKELYKELISKTHPDKYIGDSTKYEKALELSSLITQNKRNFKTLLDLKERVNKEL